MRRVGRAAVDVHVGRVDFGARRIQWEADAPAGSWLRTDEPLDEAVVLLADRLGQWGDPSAGGGEALAAVTCQSARPSSRPVEVLG